MNAFAANAKVPKESLGHSETCLSKSKSTHSKVKSLSSVEVSEFMLEKNIKDESQWLAITKERHELGEKDLYCFVVNKTPKSTSDLVKTTWHIHSDPEIICREKTTNTDAVKALLLSGECVPQVDGEWLRYAKEVLKQNKFSVYVFSAALRVGIIKGRQKNNIMLIGPQIVESHSIWISMSWFLKVL